MFGIHAVQRAKRVLLRLCPFKMNMRKNANSTSKGERIKKKIRGGHIKAETDREGDTTRNRKTD
jgi:hypothetical protein